MARDESSILMPSFYANLSLTVWSWSTRLLVTEAAKKVYWARDGNDRVSLIWFGPSVVHVSFQRLAESASVRDARLEAHCGASPPPPGSTAPPHLSCRRAQPSATPLRLWLRLSSGP